jgi:hypothetical protein
MSKTNQITKNLFEKRDDELVLAYKNGTYVSQDDVSRIQKEHGRNSVKIVTTKYPVSEHSFDYEEKDVVEQEKVLNELYKTEKVVSPAKVKSKKK